MNKKNFQYLIWAMIVALPFERLLTFDLFGFTVKPAYALAASIIFMFIYQNMIGKKTLRSFFALRRRPLASEEYLLLSLVGWSFLSALWSSVPVRSLIYSSLLALLSVIFLILRRYFGGIFNAKIRQTIIWLGIFLAFFALLQFILEPLLGYKWVLLSEIYSSRVLGFARPQATFLEPLYLANFLIWPIFFAIEEAFSAKGGLSWKLVFLFVAFFLTLSRGAYLGMMLGLLLLLLLAWRSTVLSSKSFFRVVSGVCVAIMLSGLLILTVSGVEGLKKFASHAVKTQDLAPNNRLELLKNRATTTKIARESIAARPLVGLGMAVFGSLPEFTELRQVGEWQTVNNQYLELAAELGMVGLLLFLAIIYLALNYQYHQIRSGRGENIFYLAAIIAMLAQYLTFSSSYLLYIWVMLAIVWPNPRNQNDNNLRLTPDK